MDIYNSKIAQLLKWLNRVPADHCFGITTGPETTRYSCSADQVSVRLRRHEDQHKRQYQAYGSRIRFWWAYIKELTRYGCTPSALKRGYQDNPFEVSAREAEQLEV